MYAFFAFEQAEYGVAADAQGGAFNARLFSWLQVQHFALHTLGIGPAHIHAHDHFRPVLGIGAARAGMDIHNGVHAVFFRAQQQAHFHAFKLRVQTLYALGQRCAGFFTFCGFARFLGFFGQATPDELLRHAFTLANERIDDHALANPNAQGMGCTCVAVLGIRDHFWVAHAGDSRAYRVREGNVEQLTVDHTMVQELVSQGLLKPEQAAVHPYRGRISRCLGHGQQKCDADITEHTLEHGDNLLLCSDGLSDVVGNPEIAALVGQRDVRDASRRLIEAANKAGGPDNISAIVMRRVV